MSETIGQDQERLSVSTSPLESISFLSPYRHWYKGLSEQEKHVKETVHQSLLTADAVVIKMGTGDGVALGDVIVQTAYVQAVRAALDSVGKRSVPVKLIVDTDMDGLFNDMATNDGRILVEQNNSEQPLETYALEMKGENMLTLHFDYDETMSNQQTIGARLPTFQETEYVQQGRKKRISALSGLFYAGLVGYAKQGQDHRYLAYIEDLFSLEKGKLGLYQAQPEIPLGQDREVRYQQVVKQSNAHIPEGAFQITLLPDSAFAGKRYSLDNWYEVSQKLLANIVDMTDDRDVCLNVIYNPFSKSMSKQQLEQHFSQLAGKRVYVNYIHGNLRELASFLSYQQFVMGNDTGLAHLAAAIPDGPHVLTLFLESCFPQRYYISSMRQSGISSDADKVAGLRVMQKYEIMNDPQATELNRIKPSRVVEKAVDILLKAYA